MIVLRCCRCSKEIYLDDSHEGLDQEETIITCTEVDESKTSGICGGHYLMVEVISKREYKSRKNK